jgi:hypothetical protein
MDNSEAELQLASYTLLLTDKKVGGATLPHFGSEKHYYV